MKYDQSRDALERYGLLRQIGNQAGSEYAFHHVLSQ